MRQISSSPPSWRLHRNILRQLIKPIIAITKQAAIRLTLSLPLLHSASTSPNAHSFTPISGFALHLSAAVPTCPAPRHKIQPHFNLMPMTGRYSQPGNYIIPIFAGATIPKMYYTNIWIVPNTSSVLQIMPTDNIRNSSPTKRMTSQSGKHTQKQQH